MTLAGFLSISNKHWIKYTYYFAYLGGMIIGYPINKIYNWKELPISYLYVKSRWRSYECNTCSNVEWIRFDVNVSIITNLN